MAEFDEPSEAAQRLARRVYLGDAVYAHCDGFNIWLTTGDGGRRRSIKGLVVPCGRSPMIAIGAAVMRSTRRRTIRRCHFEGSPHP